MKTFDKLESVLDEVEVKALKCDEEKRASLYATLVSTRAVAKKSRTKVFNLTLSSIVANHKIKQGAVCSPTLLIVWEIFGFILPDKIQRDAFDPAFNNMLEDYLRARKSRGKWARRWIDFAFTLCAIFIVADCFRVLLQSGVGRILLGLLPEHLRNWWRRQ